MSTILMMNEGLDQSARPCELHDSLKHIMRLCRWAGAFPVEGLNDLHPWRVRFNLKSFYTIYYIKSTVFICLMLGECIRRQFFMEKAHSLDVIMQLIFLIENIIVVALLYKLAKHWPILIKAATDIELKLTDAKTSGSIHVKTGIITYAVLFLAFVEHFLFIAFKFKLVMSCLGYTEIGTDAIDSFFKIYFEYFFQYFPYNKWLGLYAEFIGIQEVFIWNCSDIIGMCFSIYLISYFQDVGRMVNSKKPKDWKKIRTCYSYVVVLLNLINEQLAPFILMSCFTHLFFIVLQLFKSLHFVFNKPILRYRLCEGISNHNVEDVGVPLIFLFYNLFSFVFLMTKALTFAYLAANVHTTANKIVPSLYEVPASEYNQEVECLQMLLRYTTVGLSGIFFIVKRKTILRVIGTIITYELVLLQFSYPIHESDGHDALNMAALNDLPVDIS